MIIQHCYSFSFKDNERGEPEVGYQTERDSNDECEYGRICRWDKLGAELLPMDTERRVM